MKPSTNERVPATGRLRNPELHTEYFEIDSAHMGARFAIGVSLPAAYRTTDVKYPALYATDGNVFGPIAEAVKGEFEVFDAVVPIEPFLQINIGFTEEQTPQTNTLRQTNLVLPGSTIPDFMDAHVRKRLGAEAVATFRELYTTSKADHFLAFIEKELHPEICRRYRVQADAVGLFGYSAGGLFSLYAMTSGSQVFTRYGAASAGAFAEDSQVFGLYEQLLQRTAGTERKTHLHLSINAKELFGPVRLYRMNMINLLRFHDAMVERPMPGLQITTEILPNESHSSGWLDAYRSFVRACYRKPS
ncbi:hypothetical protein J7E49_22250 [Variovorax paradoxus]|nr:hypothetical protein [Variovorax paradoxus]